jgi:uncharacterized protein (UPF0332 family)
MTRREIDELIEKARRSLAAAERLLADGDADFAISRAYYAMFYAARALLLTKDIRRSKHSGVIAAFNEHFIRNGAVRHELFISLRDAFDDRSEGDYGLVTISMEQGRASVQAAREFVKELGDLLQRSAE